MNETADGAYESSVVIISVHSKSGCFFVQSPVSQHLRSLQIWLLFSDSLSLLSAPCRGPHRSALHYLRVRAIPVSSTALPSELPLRLHAGAAADEGAIQRVAVLE